jgi:hypothetical protein
MDTIISKFRAAYQARDVDALGRLYKAEAELSDSIGALLQLDSKNRLIQGRKSIKEFFDKLFVALPPGEQEIKITRRYEGDTYSVIEYEEAGMIFCHCFESEEGLIKKQRIYWGSLPSAETLTNLLNKLQQFSAPAPVEPAPQTEEPQEEPVSPSPDEPNSEPINEPPASN